MKHSDESIDLGELRSALAAHDWTSLARMLEGEHGGEATSLDWLRGCLRHSGGTELLHHLVKAFAHYEDQTVTEVQDGISVRLEPNGKLYVVPEEALTGLRIEVPKTYSKLNAFSTTPDSWAFLVSSSNDEEDFVWLLLLNEWLNKPLEDLPGKSPWRLILANRSPREESP